MNLNEYNLLQNLSKQRVNNVSLEIRRPLIDKINWNDKLISIKGSRGVGKTTLILQHIKETFEDNLSDALYVSLDNIFFETHSLFDVAMMHYQNGGTHLFIDEIQYHSKWQTIIKNIYDQFPDLHICYSGSSLLKIDNKSGDLSRRLISYELPGLSFREYLIFEKKLNIEAVSLEELLENHETITNDVVKEIKVLKHFNEYLKEGYYPFYKEVYSGYNTRLLSVINQILESDYPSVEKINYSTISKIKKMLYILAQSCPQTPNMSKLYAELETDRNMGIKMLYLLEKARLINLLSNTKSNLKNMSRPDKIYLDNTNLMYSLTENVDVGTKRETFVINQLRSAGKEVTYPIKGDFLVNNKYLFEVGGKGKNFDQIKDIQNSYLIIDDIEQGVGNRIPLWAFGLLY